MSLKNIYTLSTYIVKKIKLKATCNTIQVIVVKKIRRKAQISRMIAVSSNSQCNQSLIIERSKHKHQLCWLHYSLPVYRSFLSKLQFTCWVGVMPCMSLPACTKLLSYLCLILHVMLTLVFLCSICE